MYTLIMLDVEVPHSHYVAVYTCDTSICGYMRCEVPYQYNALPNNGWIKYIPVAHRYYYSPLTIYMYLYLTIVSIWEYI